MKHFPIFQLCKTADNYEVYYDYEKEKLYGCYTAREEVTPNYGILLVQPFLICLLEYFGSRVSDLGPWGRHFIWFLTLGLTTILVNVFWKNWIEKTEDVRNKRIRAIPEPEKTEWMEYLDLGEKQLKKRIHSFIWMGIGMIGSAILFLWNGFLVFLIIYMVLYFILYVLAVVENPIRKYKFIKERKKA